MLLGNRFLYSIFASIIFVSGAAACDRTQRNVEFSGHPVTVYSDKDSWPEVVFPEKIRGRLKETPEGLTDQFTVMSDRMYFQTSDPIYSGYIYAHGVSGKTYTVKVVARTGCADSTVYIHSPDFYKDKEAKVDSQDKGRRKKGLLEYLYLNKKPRGFYEIKLPGNKQDRLVYKQGPVHFYLQKMWKGHHLNGFVLEAENLGRTPYKVAIQAIDYQSKEIRKLFGKVRKITMNPTDFRLGPSPEYASDVMHPANKGLIYIVSEKPKRKRFGG